MHLVVGSPMPTGTLPPARDHAFPAREKAKVENEAKDWLAKYPGVFWPNAVVKGTNGLDWDKLVDLGNASGALISGLIYDFLGSYHYAMLAYMVLYLVATLCIFLAGRPRQYAGP